MVIADNCGTFVWWDEVVSNELPHPTDDAPAGARAELLRTPSPERSSSEGLFDEEVDDDWIIDDVEGLYKDDRPKARPWAPPADGRASTYTSSTSVTRGQDPFQPGATPIKDKRRYLAFNQVGVIHLVERDGYNTVTLDFHDRGAHPTSHWDDTLRCTMACLTDQGALYACPAKGDSPAVVTYKPHEAWNVALGEWLFKLPKGESIVAIGLGSVGAVVATDAGYLRCFTVSGLQSQLIDLGKEVVSMVVGEEWIFVVHRAGSNTFDGK